MTSMFYTIAAATLLGIDLTGTFEQLRKTYLTKDARDLSLFSLALFTSGLCYSVVFAFGTGIQWPYLIAFSCQAAMILALFILTYKYNNDKDRASFAFLVIFLSLPVLFLATQTFYFGNEAAAETAGWIRSYILAARCLPQLIHTWQRKSVAGFSTYRVLSSFATSIAYLFLAIEFDHHASAIANNARIVALEAIGLAQFGYYSYQDKKASQK